MRLACKAPYVTSYLAVGDESFQKKSGKALLELIKGGVTTVYVSHSMGAVKNLRPGDLLEQGELRAEGAARLVVV